MQETQRKSPYADQTQGHKTKAVTQTFCNTKIQKDSTNVKRFDKELIRARLPFNTLIDHYGFKVDSHDKLVCPFHIDSQASATVRNNYFYCYGCGEKADVFRFIMLMENCSFSRAVAIAAVLAGVAPSSSADVRQAIEARKRLHEQLEHTRRASDRKYSLLARIARLSRDFDVPYAEKLDTLLEQWLKTMPAMADLRPLEFAFKHCSPENVGRAIDRLFSEAGVRQ